jgi:hypothetical protein
MVWYNTKVCYKKLQKTQIFYDRDTDNTDETDFNGFLVQIRPYLRHLRFYRRHHLSGTKSYICYQTKTI